MKNPAFSGKRTREACVRGITAEKTQRSLRTQQQRQLYLLYPKTDTDVVTLTVDLLTQK